MKQLLRGRAKAHHYFNGLNKPLRIVLIVVAAICLMVIAFQLVFPSDRALPFAKVGGDSVGLKKQDEIVALLNNEYKDADLEITVRGKTTKVVATKAGVITDNDRIIDEVSDYEWYWRVVPFSLFVRGLSTDQEVSVKTDALRFAQFARERQKECFVAPKNAGVKVNEKGAVVLDPAKDGQDCTPKSLAPQITNKTLTKQGMKVIAKTDVVKPARSDKDVKPLLKEAKKLTERKMVVAVAGKTYAVDQPTIGAWLAFPEDEKTKKITVGVNKEAVKAYLNTIQKDTYIAPGVTVVTTVDSIETGRATGSAGRGIDMDTTAAAIEKQLLGGDGSVTATLAALPARVVYNRSYSKTPAGLQALLNDIVKDKGDFAISVRKLGDSGVHVNGDKQYHPASTYKLFVAYSVLKRVDDGRLSLSQVSSGGQNIAQCLDNMIVNSDNACAEWFGSTAIGWGSISAEARALGASRTSLTRPFISTTNDQALFLQKLESNQLGLSEPSRERLLSAMKRQVFRRAIPAGTGVPVADKVGFLEGLLHDSAIVYSPKGVYVLVIYSYNSSWAAMADAARQIHAQLQ